MRRIARTSQGLIVRMNKRYRVTIPATRYTLRTELTLDASCERKAIEEAVRHVALYRVDSEGIEQHGIPLDFAAIFTNPWDRPAGFSIERIPSDDAEASRADRQEGVPV